MSHFESDVLWNPAWDTGRGRRVVSVAEIRAFHESIPGYAPTPLVSVPAVAAEFGVAHVLVKHEAERFGLPSFKIVGASWAVNAALSDVLGLAPQRTLVDLQDAVAPLRGRAALTTATDGNHGRAVARMARELGLDSIVYVPDEIASARADAIRAERAEVEVVPGSYDAAVRYAADCAARSAEDGGLRHVLVSDTSWDGYTRIPLAVSDGYTTIFEEMKAQFVGLLGSAATIDVAVVPVGVGAFASAAVNSLLGCAVVSAEPTAADCLWRSLEAGKPVVVPGPHGSTMAGLNCGEVSYNAWPVLAQGVRAAVRLSDLEATAAVRELAGLGIASSESGAASLAALRRLRLDARAGSLLRPASSVVLFDTEGVTDQVAYNAAIARKECLGHG
jgi:diaminopropionate ammonia-lyase